MNTRSRTLRNTMYSSVGMYTEYALGMVTSIIIARHLGPDGFGLYSVAIWLVAMGVAATNSGTASAAIKFVAELRGSGNDGVVRVLLGFLRRAQRLYLLVVIVVAALVLLFARDRIAPGVDHWILLAFLALAIALRASYMFNIGVAKGFENFRAVATVALVAAPANLAMVLVAWWLGASVEWLLAVFLASGVVFYLVSRRLVSPLVPEAGGAVMQPVLAGRVRRHMWLSSLTVTMGFVAASEVEVVFLNIFDGPESAGQFKVAYQLAIGMATLVPGVFGALLLPMMANAVAQGGGVAGRRFSATTVYLTLLAAPLVAFGVVFPASVIELLYGTAYASAAPVFAICLAGAAIVCATQGASSMLISADRQGSVLLLVIGYSVFKVIVDVVLIRSHGLMGAAAAYLCAALVASATMVLLAIRHSGASPDWGRLGRSVLAAALAGVAVLPLAHVLPPLAAVVVGGGSLVVVYALATLLFGCWTRADIEHMQRLHQRFVSGRPRAGGRLLEWARKRAPGEASA